jgi:hypothetical protein
MSKSIFRSLAGLIITIVIGIASSGKAVAQTQTNGGGTPNYVGYVDHTGCDLIGGWAADRNNLGNSIAVKIYSDGMFVANTTANLSRPDVGNHLGDNGLHGYTVATPPFLKDGQTHQIAAYFESSTVALTNSGASLFCAPASPPPLCADHVITTTPNQGPSAMVVNYLCRDANLRTRYDSGRFVTIDDPIAQQTLVADAVARTYSVISWRRSAPPDGGSSQTASLTTEGSSVPPPRPNTACQSPGTTYSVNRLPVPPPPSGPAPVPQTLNVWSCASLVLPMYVEIIDPSFGTRDLEFKNISLASPDPQLFTVPPGYTRDDLFSMSPGLTPVSGTGCGMQQTVDPLILVTSSARRGQTVVTAVASGFGCTFSDATIYAGPALSAVPLTSIGGPVFQFSLSDASNPGYSSHVDTAQVSLSTSDGVVSTRSLIFVKID